MGEALFPFALRAPRLPPRERAVLPRHRGRGFPGFGEACRNARRAGRGRTVRLSGVLALRGPSTAKCRGGQPTKARRRRDAFLRVPFSSLIGGPSLSRPPRRSTPKGKGVKRRGGGEGRAGGHGSSPNQDGGPHPCRRRSPFWTVARAGNQVQGGRLSCHRRGRSGVPRGECQGP